MTAPGPRPGRLRRPRAESTARFDRLAYAVLVLAVLLIVGSLAQKIYRLTLPTDGWAFVTGEVTVPDEIRPIYTSNLLGEPSPILSGDRLLAVEGYALDELNDRGRRLRAVQLPNWRAGESAIYLVERDGREVELAVPLYHWTAGAALRHVLRDLGLLASFPLSFIGWFVFLRRPLERASYPLLLFSTSLLVATISTTITGVGLPELVTPNILPIATLFSNWIWVFVMFPSLLLLTLTFPRPKRFVERFPRSTVALVYGLAAATVAFAGMIAIVGWLILLGMVLLSMVALGHSLVTVTDPVGRAQARWAVSGLAVIVVSYIPLILAVFGVMPDPPQWGELILFPIMLTAVTLGFAIAILRYRLFDIDIIINRTLVYAVLTALLLSAYYVSVVTLQSIFRALTGQDSDITIVLSTLVVAALFQPLRRRVQRFIDRRFYRRRYDAGHTLTAFGARIQHEVDLSTLIQSLTTVVQGSMHPSTMSLWLPSSDSPATRADAMRDRPLSSTSRHGRR